MARLQTLRNMKNVSRALYFVNRSRPITHCLARVVFPQPAGAIRAMMRASEPSSFSSRRGRSITCGSRRKGLLSIDSVVATRVR